MKNGSSFERVVGRMPDTEKEHVLRRASFAFQDQETGFSGKEERRKTPAESEILALVNAKSDEIRRHYGLPDFDIPEKNIHVIRAKKWTAKDDAGCFFPLTQAIRIPEEPTRLGFMKTALHEMIHFKSYASLQESGYDINEYRMGLVTHKRDGDREFFRNINEAVTEELARRYSKELSGHDLFKKERSLTEMTKSRYPDARTASGIPLFDEQTYYAAPKKRGLREFLDTGFEGWNTVTINTRHYSYEQEREALNILIDKLFEANRQRFRDRDEVFDIFANAMLSGHMHALGRLIDRTFGAGTFRKLGESGEDTTKLEKLIDSLVGKTPAASRETKMPLAKSHERDGSEALGSENDTIRRLRNRWKKMEELEKELRESVSPKEEARTGKEPFPAVEA